MWYYQIVKNGECIEGGMFADEDKMRRYCERRMKQLGADYWWAEYRNE